MESFMSNEKTILECKKVSFAYDGHVVVKDIHLCCKQGDYICIIGENGSGKSTLVKGLLGLLKPCEGKIDFLGVARNQVGYLPQHMNIKKDFPASVFEVVLSGCLNRHTLFGFYTEKDREKALDNMKKLNVYDLRKKSFRELSGGQRQRVLLARALCATKSLLLLDEPVSGLDPIMTKELYHVVEELNKKENITVIMVSHDIRSAALYGNKILYMSEGTATFYNRGEFTQSSVYHNWMGGNR